MRVPSLTLYHAPQSSSSRVYWALLELGLPFETKKVDLRGGEQKTPEFLRLNPNGKVPVLVVDGQPMFESLAMLLFLGETYGVDKGLFPAPGLQRAKAYQWILWAGVTLNECFYRFVLNTTQRIPEEQKNAKVAEAARGDLNRLFGILESALTSDYLLGPEFSLVDIALVAYVAFLEQVGIDLSSFPKISAWKGRCSDRPASVRTASE